MLVANAESKLLNCWFDFLEPDVPVGAAPPWTLTEPGAIDRIVIELEFGPPTAVVSAYKKVNNWCWTYLKLLIMSAKSQNKMIASISNP